VLFICQGNINRSAVAERALTAYVRASEHRASIASAGFDPRAGRHTTSISLGAAGNLNIDLRDHASTPLTREMLARFDLIVAMEISHLVRLSELDAQAARDAIVLAVLDPEGGPVDIPDPDGKVSSTFSTIYARIVRCVEQLGTTMCASGASLDTAGARTSPLRT
jgi:protein-tyrosine phosphatase